MSRSVSSEPIFGDESQDEQPSFYQTSPNNPSSSPQLPPHESSHPVSILNDAPLPAHSSSRPPTRPVLTRIFSSPPRIYFPGSRRYLSETQEPPLPPIHHPKPPHEREWTLFGQILNQGPILTSRRQRAQPFVHEGASTTSPQVQSPNRDLDPFISLPNHVVASQPTPLSTEPEPISLQNTVRHDFDSDSDSDTSESADDSDAESNMHKHSVSKSRFRLLPLTRLQKNVLKCSLAYLIASLFTLVPYLSGFLADVPSRGKWEGGPSPSGHMVATVCVPSTPNKKSCVLTTI